MLSEMLTPSQFFFYGTKIVHNKNNLGEKIRWDVSDSLMGLPLY